MQLHHRRHHQHRWRTSSGGAEYVCGAFEAFAGRLAKGARGHSGFHAQGKTGPVRLTPGNSNNNERLGRNTMGLAIATTSFECTIDGGLAHIVLNQPDRGNPIDGDFCREFNLCMAELSERDDVRSVLISARGRLFSVGGDLAALASRDDAVVVEAEKIARELASGPTEAYGGIKRLFLQTLNRSIESQLEDEAQTLAAISRTADAREGVKAFREKRKPKFAGK